MKRIFETGEPIRANYIDLQFWALCKQHEAHQSLKLDLGQRRVCCVGDFIILARAYEDGWPELPHRLVMRVEYG